MGMEDYQKLINKIRLIADRAHPWDGTYIAEDDRGSAYDLLLSGHLDRVVLRTWNNSSVLLHDNCMETNERWRVYGKKFCTCKNNRSC